MTNQPAQQAAILDTLPANIALLDADGIIVAVNAAWRRFADNNSLLTPGYAVGTNYLRICDSAGSDDRLALEAAAGIRAVVSGAQERYSLEYPCHSPTQQRWFQLEATPLAETRPRGVVVMHLDITKERQAREDLRVSEHRLSELLETVDLAAVMLDENAHIVYCNEYLLKMSGWRAEEIYGRDWIELFIPGEIRNEVRVLFENLMAGQPLAHHHENEILTRTGERSTIRWNNTLFRSAAGKTLGTASIGEDVTTVRQHEERLRQSDERMRATIDNSLDSIVIMDAFGRILEFNPAAERLFGYRRSEIMGKQLREAIIPERLREAHERGFQRFLATGKGTLIGRRVEMPAIRADGTELLVELAITSASQGDDTICTAFMRDVTMEREAAQKMAESEQRFRELADHIDDVYWLANADMSRVLYISPAYELIWGRSCASLYASPRNWADAIHPDDRERVHAAAFNKSRDGDYSQEYRILRPDGSERWIRDRGFAIRDASGRLQRFGGVASDITERRQGELLLSRQNRALKMLSACNEALIRTQDELQLLAAVCRIAVEIGGYRMAWVGYAQDDEARSIKPMAQFGDTGNSLANARLSWDAASTQGSAASARAIRNSEVIVVPDLESDAGLAPWREVIRRNGFRSTVCLPLMGNERTFGVLSLFSAEVANIGLDETKLLQEMADNMAFGINNLRTATETRQLQDAVLKIAQGVSEGSGGEFFELLTRSVVAAVQADGGLIGRVTPGPRAMVQCQTMLMDGKQIEGFSFALAGTPAEAIVGGEQWMYERDLHLRFPTDLKLQRFSLESYAGAPLHDSQGNILGILSVFFRGPIQRPALVKSALRIFATRASSEMERQLAETSLKEQASLLDEAHDAIFVRGIDDHLRFWNRGAERMFGWTSAEALGRSIEELLCDQPSALHEAVTGVILNGVYGGDIELRRKDGGHLTVAAHWTLVRDDHGRPKAILCINTDITRRLALERQMQQSQRLEAVGQLTGGVAHDFNNLLTVILGNSELLAERLADNRRLHMLAEMIRSAAQRGADLTTQLLAFARRQKLEPKAVDADQLLSGMEGLLRRTLREDIQLTRKPSANLWQALVDPAQLEGAILNLCINSRDAMASGGELILETGNVAFDEESAHQNPDIQPGEYVMVAVSDSGHGIPAEHLKRVFEPFFTTKEFGKGTGLGLSMVYGFVKQSQGHVTIYSELGVGTSVKMFLPRANRTADAAPTAEIATPESRGTEKVLLAEDDDLVRSYAEDQLLELGYRVVSARNGAEALICLREQPDIDLLFTDVVMPGGLNGPELAEAARKIKPGLKVLFTSGYTDNAIAMHARLGREVQLLTKPYRRTELAQKLRLALSQPLP